LAVRSFFSTVNSSGQDFLAYHPASQHPLKDTTIIISIPRWLFSSSIVLQHHTVVSGISRTEWGKRRVKEGVLASSHHRHEPQSASSVVSSGRSSDLLVDCALQRMALPALLLQGHLRFLAKTSHAGKRQCPFYITWDSCHESRISRLTLVFSTACVHRIRHAPLQRPCNGECLYGIVR
jgi:hypothetical protein